MTTSDPPATIDMIHHRRANNPGNYAGKLVAPIPPKRLNMPLPARILHHPATLILASTLLGGCGVGDHANYTQDIEPVLHQHCLHCHSHTDNATPKGGFSVDTYVTLIQGGDHGPVITPDHPDASKLVHILFGKMKFYDADGDHYAPMNQGQREALIEWIELGALNSTN